MKRKEIDFENNERPNKIIKYSKDNLIDELIKYVDAYNISCWLIIGYSGCGKSYLLNLFLSTYYCDKRFYFSPTIETPKFKYNEWFSDWFLNINKIIQIIEYQEENKINNKELDSIQIVINDYYDCLCDKKIRKVLSQIATKGRHLKLTLIIASQDYTSIPTEIRKQCRNMIIFGTTNKNELINIKRLGYITPFYDISYYISGLSIYEYICQFQSKIDGKIHYCKCKNLDIIEKITNF